MIIYKVTNKINGKCYIGKTVKKYLSSRRSGHIYEMKKGSKFYFHNSLRKYGKENFEWEILYECTDHDILKEKELYYIKYFNTFKPNGYNLTKGGDGNFGYKYSEESKKKMSESHKGNRHSEETKMKISEGNKGRVPTKATREKISKKLTGVKFSDERKNNISKALKKYYKMKG